MAYSQEDLINILQEFEKVHGKLPTQRELRALGVTEDPFTRIFGGITAAKEYYYNLMNPPKPLPDHVKLMLKKAEGITKRNKRKCPTTLVIPDAHVGPDQDNSRFVILNKLILDQQPDYIIFMGDFVTLESLSNWDLNKAGVMEGRRYQLDIEAGCEALSLTLQGVKELYSPTIIYLHGNHETRLDRYIEGKPELKDHLNLNKDLRLSEYGIDVIVPYREYYVIEGTQFTHSPMNAANQALSGKFAIHRASEMTQNSLVFAHSHRKEYVNFYRHGSDDIVQVMMCGAFFEHTDSYAYGGLNAYWRGCMILNHWKSGRYDAEEFSLERLKELY
jgi:predicted MPP superfamily phosphohydrolase